MKISAVFTLLLFISSAATSATELGFISGPQDERPGNQPAFVLLADGDLDDAFVNQIVQLNYWWLEKDVVLNAAESQNLPVCKIHVQSNQVTAKCECAIQHKDIVHNRDEKNSTAKTITELEDIARFCERPIPTI